MEFTIQEIDVMLESLEKWAQESPVGMMLGVFLGATLKDPSEKRKFDEEQRQQEEKEKQAAANRKQRAILIQAKLIHMRDAILADKLMNGERV
jgi:hypothetical protein